MLQPWRVLDASGHPARNMVTGYYEPLVQASRTRGGDYQWPLYAPPDNLLTIDLGSVYPELAGKRVRGKLVGKRGVPYDTRAQIATERSEARRVGKGCGSQGRYRWARVPYKTQKEYK